MERRLLPINAWIALHKGGAGWPTRLAEQGFEIHRFEVPITVASGTVVVDVTSVRADTPTVVVVEAKSGGSVSNEQAVRYAEITPIDVHRHAGLSIDTRAAAQAVVYACTLEGRGGVRVDLDRLDLGFPLLVVGDSIVRLEPEASTVIKEFEDKVPGPPPRYVAVDQDSSDDELLEYLIPELIAAASRGLPFVGIDALLRGVLPYWDVYGASVRRTLIRRSRDALARVIAGALSGSFAFEPGPQRGDKSDVPVIKIVKNPTAFDPRGQTQSWQRLERQAAKALRRPTRAESPGQQTLFEDLGLAVDQP